MRSFQVKIVSKLPNGRKPRITSLDEWLFIAFENNNLSIYTLSILIYHARQPLSRKSLSAYTGVFAAFILPAHNVWIFALVFLYRNISTTYGVLFLSGHNHALWESSRGKKQHGRQSAARGRKRDPCTQKSPGRDARGPGV